MLRAPLAALVFCIAAQAYAQDGGVAAPAAPAAAAAPKGSEDDLRRELEAKLEGTRREIKEIRDEVRAQAATGASQGWQEDSVEEKRKLEIFVPDGYFRVRPELFHRFDLNRAPDESGFPMFPRSPASNRERTIAGVNMRFRFDPTFNISEEVRIRMQVDALDNVLFGSTPDYSFSKNPYARDSFTIFSQSQSPPTIGLNSITDSIAVKRIYGEVSTPVGILRFGRMGSHWGLGMLHHDGNGIDDDLGDTVDRLSFVAEPFSGFFVTPMLDFNAEGPPGNNGSGQVFDASNNDDAHSFLIAVARRDTDTQAKAKLDAGGFIFNYGVHFSYRVQNYDPADYYANGVAAGPENFVPRFAKLFIPDVWLKYEIKNFRVELEAAAIFGNIGNRAATGADANTPGLNQGLDVLQFGGVLQGEYRLLDGALKIMGEVGFASGDRAPGFGNYPRRLAKGPGGATQPGDIDGPQYACPDTGGCADPSIRNFRFNRAYRADMILFRELLGGITDTLYVKPSVSYRITEGFHAFGGVIYSRAIYPESTPSAALGSDGVVRGSADLGLEFNVGARYETEDGFFAELKYGFLLPLDGLKDTRASATGQGLDPADAVRGTLGIKF
jgi:uncharacterized protein (TIGR04551 family)